MLPRGCGEHNSSRPRGRVVHRPPVTLTLEDYAATEKIAYLPRKLSTDGAPPGFNPSVGAVTYYAPWGNLAIFHKDARYADGLIELGRIESGLELLAARGPVRVTIELADKPRGG